MIEPHAHVYERRVDASGPYKACTVRGCDDERDYPAPFGPAEAQEGFHF